MSACWIWNEALQGALKGHGQKLPATHFRPQFCDSDLNEILHAARAGHVHSQLCYLYVIWLMFLEHSLGCYTSTERGRLGLSLSAIKLAKLHNGVGDIFENVTFFCVIGTFRPRSSLCVSWIKQVNNITANDHDQLISSGLDLNLFSLVLNEPKFNLYVNWWGWVKINWA